MSEKENKKPQILIDLERVANIIPAPIYWEDVNSIILGGNEAVFKGTGAVTRENYVGKSLYELYPKEMATHIKLHNEKVMKTGKTLSQEEPIADITTKEKKYFTAIKAPLYDNGEIIGIVGTSIDITAEKEAERLRLENLRLENEIQKQLLAEQEKFTELATQVAHDIRSPLAALNTAIKYLPQLPEQERIILRSAVERINDIATNLLHEYKHAEISEKETGIHSWLVVPFIESIVTEKRLQWDGSGMTLQTTFSDEAYTTFANVELVEMKRVLSNLLNNAAEAVNEKAGRIHIQVGVHDKQVDIKIIDNGCGIPAEKLPTIFTDKKTTKEKGYGLGLSHAKQTIERMQGTIGIESIIDKGTTITVTLPKAANPAWFKPDIVIEKDATIIVLDDDESIHGAWDTRFNESGLENPVLHFREGDAFIRWRETNPTTTIKVFSDYELLGEAKSGLDIIEELKIGRQSILITSHYENQIIIERCIQLGVTLLPKNLVAHIPLTPQQHQQNEPRVYDAILIDDDELVISVWQYNALKQKKTLLTFQSIAEVEASLAWLDKSKPIYLDCELGGAIKGDVYAKQLYERGFTTLYLVTGHPKSHFGDMPWIKDILSKTPVML